MHVVMYSVFFLTAVAANTEEEIWRGLRMAAHSIVTMLCAWIRSLSEENVIKKENVVCVYVHYACE